MHTTPLYSTTGIPLIAAVAHPAAAQTACATVLCADLHGYGALVEQLPPLRVLPLVEEFLRILSAAVLQHGGLICHLSEAAMMAGFGVGDPRHTQIHEALEAAREIQRRFTPVSASWRRSLAIDTGVGIGIHRGDVAIGLHGSGGDNHAALVGDAANVAALLCKRARVGEMLLTAAVYPACRGVRAGAAQVDSAHYLHLPAVRLAGRSTPLQVWCAPAAANLPRQDAALPPPAPQH